ncbi:MAG: hypothetical protein DI556_08725 [Rhodovulum sulfidophilum]|uniref:DUF1656 domain-containing protein n=1 Tax=Rhodovulum sulfidophilum TaxID=35806 RepID=A0A2W5N9H7_RHOSU|nr:MAG: hypothetical protein DI556_08725 [Rhodovulum sulfidophilum]
MTQQLDIYGVFVPTLAVMALASFVLSRIASRILARAGLYRFVWHRPLFDLALYVIVLGGAFLLLQRIHWS